MPDPEATENKDETPAREPELTARVPVLEFWDMVRRTNGIVFDTDAGDATDIESHVGTIRLVASYEEDAATKAVAELGADLGDVQTRVLQLEQQLSDAIDAADAADARVYERDVILEQRITSMVDLNEKTTAEIELVFAAWDEKLRAGGYAITLADLRIVRKAVAAQLARLGSRPATRTHRCAECKHESETRAWSSEGWRCIACNKVL